MTNDTTEPSGDSGNDPAEEKTQPQDVSPAPSHFSRVTAVKVEGNTVTVVQRTHGYIKLVSTSGTGKRITEERQGQLYCKTCETPCGFTDQPALERYEDTDLCPKCILDILNRKRKELRDYKLSLED